MASLSPPEEASASSYHHRRSKRYSSSSTTTNGLSESDKRRKISLPSSSSFISPSEIEAEFSHHDPAFARINNGSFGSCPSSVVAAQRHWQLRFLSQPDRFFFDDLKPSITASRAAIRRLINAEHDDEVSLVDNATTAAAIVLQQTAWAFREGRFDRGDAVVMLHYAFGSVKKSVEAYVSRSGGEVIEVQLPFPVISSEEIVNRFRTGLELGKKNGRRVRLALIDHVTSMPSVVIPIKELVKICREEGVDQVFVDAAHGIGCVDVDMKEIGADFYTSNLHKWFFAPPSVAFLYCRRASGGGSLHHPVVSHEYGNGLAVESTWVGTRDYSAQLVVPSILEFVNRFEGGIDGIKRRNHESVVEMGKMLVESWGTQFGCPVEMCASMVMVGLPVCLGVSSEADAVRLRNLLRERFRIEIPTYFRAPGEGETGDSITGYVRISFQVYNKLEEYHRLRDAVNELVRDGFKCTSLTD